MWCLCGVVCVVCVCVFVAVSCASCVLFCVHVPPVRLLIVRETCAQFAFNFCQSHVGVVSHEYCEEIPLNKCQEEPKQKRVPNCSMKGARTSGSPRATVSGSPAYRTNAATMPARHKDLLPKPALFAPIALATRSANS